VRHAAIWGGYGGVVNSLNATRHLGRGLFHALAELGHARSTPPRSAVEASHRLAGALGAIGRAHELVVTTRGEVPRGRALVVANHVSYLDPLAILPHCPALPLAKSEVAGWPVIGSIGAALGVMYVARDEALGRARTLRRVHDVLAAGAAVLNFPEGTTTAGDRVLPFWRGTFGIAQRLGVPVVPVTICYDDPDLAWFGGAAFVPHYLRVAARRRVTATVVFGAPMLPRTGEPAEAMAARARNVIARTLADLKGPTDATTRRHVSPPRSDAVLPPARVARAG
jgi:1-acyl-sn-glycerol-3-phosphate acyltransferase